MLNKRLKLVSFSEPQLWFSEPQLWFSASQLWFSASQLWHEGTFSASQLWHEGTSNLLPTVPPSFLQNSPRTAHVQIKEVRRSWHHLFEVILTKIVTITWFGLRKKGAKCRITNLNKFTVYLFISPFSPFSIILYPCYVYTLCIDIISDGQLDLQSEIAITAGPNYCTHFPLVLNISADCPSGCKCFTLPGNIRRFVIEGRELLAVPSNIPYYTSTL